MIIELEGVLYVFIKGLEDLYYDRGFKFRYDKETDMYEILKHDNVILKNIPYILYKGNSYVDFEFYKKEIEYSLVK